MTAVREMSILVVDDEIAMCAICRLLLSSAGYKVHVAMSGHEALEILSTTPVNLVLSDIRMPEMDGIELTGRIRDLYPRTSILLMSAYSKVGYTMSTSEIPSDGFLSKPFTQEQLVDACRRQLEAAPQ